MYKGERNPLQALLGLIAGMILIGSCVSPKKISYFNYVPDSLQMQPYEVQLAAYTDPSIQPNDILQISVQTIDPQATTMMGTPQTNTYSTQASQAGAGAAAVHGYLVDQQGEIEMPLVGKIKVGGMTTTEARAAIAQRAAQYYKNPVVNIRFANFVVTVLGEVTKPGQITVPNEKVSIIDALGMAGDLTIGAKRDDILLIREQNGQKRFARFSLNDPGLFQSEYFYLRQHDVLYVAPNKARAAATEVTTARIVPFLSIGISVITLIITATR